MENYDGVDDVDSASGGDELVSRSTPQTFTDLFDLHFFHWLLNFQGGFELHELQKLNIVLQKSIHGISNANSQVNGYFSQEQDRGDRDIHHPVADQEEELNPHSLDSSDEAQSISIADNKRILLGAGHAQPRTRIVDAEQERGGLPSFSNRTHSVAPSGSHIIANFITFISVLTLCYSSQSRGVFTGSWSRNVFTGSESRDLLTGAGSRCLFNGSGSRCLFTGSEPGYLFTGSEPGYLFTGSGSRDLSTGSGSRDLSTGSGSRDLSTGSGSRDLSTGSGSRDLSTVSRSRYMFTGSEPRDLFTGSGSRDLFTGSWSRGLFTGSEPSDVFTGSVSRGFYTGSESRGLCTGSESISVDTEMNNAAGSHAYCFGNTFVSMNALYGSPAVPVLLDSVQMVTQSFENVVASNDDDDSDDTSNDGSDNNLDDLEINFPM